MGWLILNNYPLVFFFHTFFKWNHVHTYFFKWAVFPPRVERSFECECITIFLISKTSDLSMFITSSRKPSKVSLTSPILILLSHHTHSKCFIYFCNFSFVIIYCNSSSQKRNSLRTGNIDFYSLFYPQHYEINQEIFKTST